jgi:O-methyltransferase
MFIKRFISKILGRFGYSIIKEINRPGNIDYGSGLGYEIGKEADPYIKVVRNNTMIPYINLLTLFEQVLFCERNDIEGDYVECGVWKGGAVGLMALANLHYGKYRRNIHLFDIFDDICAPDPNIDGEKALRETRKFMKGDVKFSGELVPLKGVYESNGGPGTIEENIKLLEEIIKYPKDKINYHKGWFQETVPETSKTIKKIAILRLDGDWYASTKVCLEFLYDKVIEGGIIIIDDYGCYEGCKKAVDEFFIKRNIIVLMNYSNSTCRYWIKNQV